MCTVLSRYLCLLLVAPVGGAMAEVIDAADAGFHLEISREVAVTPAQAYAQFLRVHEWWDADHTWFGSAENLSIDPRAGGCFCERSGGREVLHMTVSYVDPGVELRMLGGLGPLQGMGLHGAMAWKFEAVDKGGTRIVHSYRVAGYASGGLRDLAAIVDRVQTGQVEGLRARLQQDR